MFKLIRAFCLLAFFCTLTAVRAQEDSLEPLVININIEGEIFLIAEETGERLSEEQSRQVVSDRLQQDSESTIFLRADKQTSFGRVSAVLAWLTELEAQRIEILTESQEAQG